MAFAVQFVQRLRDQDPVVVPALRWLEEHLAAQGTTADEIVRVQHQRQAAMNVTVRNVITSMRLISAFDWAEFFESVSLVDAMLWTDTPFAAPDFATRDRYRHAIEELSRCSQHAELEVARRAVLHARQFRGDAQGAGDRLKDRRGDPGYYLIANGRLALEQELGFRMPI
jgi:cyclic beta-1,2-glucan synthetase